jgi:hypothetical protein
MNDTEEIRDIEKMPTFKQDFNEEHQYPNSIIRLASSMSQTVN